MAEKQRPITAASTVIRRVDAQLLWLRRAQRRPALNLVAAVVFMAAAAVLLIMLTHSRASLQAHPADGMQSHDSRTPVDSVTASADPRRVPRPRKPQSPRRRARPS